MMLGKCGKLIRNGDDRINAVVPGQLRIFLNLSWIDLCIPYFGFYDGRPSAAAVACAGARTIPGRRPAPNKG